MNNYNTQYLQLDKAIRKTFLLNIKTNGIK